MHCSKAVIFQPKKGWFVVILCVKIALRPKYLLIRRLRKNITLSGRRWKTHGSSKESGGKEAGKEGSGKEDRSKEEEIIFF
jgi:hypothetical protein